MDKLIAIVLVLCGFSMLVLATATLFGIAWTTALFCMGANAVGYLLVCFGVGILKG
jgi:hypothetical protein